MKRGDSRPVFYKECRIYCLKDLSGNIFYVGCTTQTIEQRLEGHIKEASKPGATSEKNKKIKSLDFKFCAEVLETTICTTSPINPSGNIRKLETKWINKFLSDGIELTNVEYKRQSKKQLVRVEGDKYYANVH